MSLNQQVINWVFALCNRTIDMQYKYDYKKKKKNTT